MANMATITEIDPSKRLRHARAAFVRHVIEEDGRSGRYVAERVGINPSSFSERLNGRVPFLADELEPIARVLKIDPIDFYAQYLAVGPEGFEPPTSTVEESYLAKVTPIRSAVA